MTVFHHWMRSAGAVVLAGALLAVTPAAQATDITNPADHPAPIILTIDGQDYRDGADTLPGYDDYACTPIPNVQYDFAENEIQYYDEQGDLVKTAHWTEWSRISSYETWVEQQRAASPPGSSTPSNADAAPAATSPTTTDSAATPAAATPAATSPTTTSAAAGTKRSTTKTKSPRSKTPSSTTKTSSVATKTPRPATTSASSRGTASATREQAAPSHVRKRGASTASSTKRRAVTSRPATAASAADASAAPSDATTSQGNGAPSSTATAAGTPKYELVSHKGVGGEVGDTRPVGVGILVAVFAAAGIAFLFGVGRRGIRGASR